MTTAANATAKLRFGILGTGNIARQFAGSFRTSTRCVITAVGSRTPESAGAFVAAHAPHALATSYEGLLASREVDAIYISLPNSMHAEWTIRALEAGKHVLCEKPLAMNAAEAETMFAAARRAGRLLVEAFMYVSHPLTRAYVEAVRTGKVGRVRHIRTSFCYRTTKIAGNVRFDPALGGGAMMDVGCYCLHFSRMIAGAEPTSVHIHGLSHTTGVDEQAAGLLQFPGGLTATFAVGMSLQADNTATVSGEDAYLEVPVPWKPPVTGARWALARSTPPKQDGGVVTGPPPREEFSVDAGKDLYALEADDFADAVAGLKPPAVTELDSLGNMRLLDLIRKQLLTPTS